ncbi:MAG: gluconate 2-dehydrogenase subunit 3 family protein [bacterium]
MTRREMLGATAAAFVLPLFSPRLVEALSPFRMSARFLTASEFALLDELTEMILPTDDHSPGARDARVAGEIDRRLAESVEPEWPAMWRAGLQAVDALSHELNGKSFMQTSPDNRLAVLTRMAGAELDPKAPIERFFVELKGATVRAYYTSKIGIHVDQQYKGNVLQPGAYAGFDAT